MPTPDWSTFAGVAGVLTVLLLLLARASQGAVTGESARDATGAAPGDGRDRPGGLSDRRTGSGARTTESADAGGADPGADTSATTATRPTSDPRADEEPTDGTRRLPRDGDGSDGGDGDERVPESDRDGAGERGGDAGADGPPTAPGAGGVDREASAVDPVGPDEWRHPNRGALANGEASPGDTSAADAEPGHRYGDGDPDRGEPGTRGVGDAPGTGDTAEHSGATDAVDRPRVGTGAPTSGRADRPSAPTRAEGRDADPPASIGGRVGGGSVDVGTDEGVPRGGRQLREPDLDLSTGALLANVAVSQGLFAALLIAAAWWTGVPASALGVGPVDPTTLAAGAALGVGLYLANEVGAAVGERFGIPGGEALREALAPETAGGWVVLLLVVLPIIAGFEELLFRGVLIGALSAGFGVSPWLLAAVSSVAFALGHGAQGRLGIVVTGLLGFVLAAGFVLTGSLLAVVLAHYLVNALEFVVHEGLGVDWR